MPEVSVEGPNENDIALAEALKRLPKDQRQVLEMKYLLGMSNAEVGAILDRSPGAVNALQWRALKAMRTDMEPA